MLNVHSYDRRGALCFWETHRKRLVSAIGGNVISYELRPDVANAAGTDPTGWTTTVVEAGAGGDSNIVPATDAGYAWNLITDNADNDGVSAQLLGTPFELTSDQDLYCGFEFEINDVTQTDFFLGLAVTDTAILGGVTDRIGFESLDGSTDMTFALEKDSTQTLTSSLHTLVDDTLVFAEFYWDGSTIAVFVDGVEQTAPAVTNLPDDVAMRLSLEFLTGETTANTMKIRQGRIIQIGR